MSIDTDCSKHSEPYIKMHDQNIQGELIRIKLFGVLKNQEMVLQWLQFGLGRDNLQVPTET